MPDIDFGGEPRTLVPDLKILLRKFFIGEKSDRKKLDATEARREGYWAQSRFFQLRIFPI